MSHQNQTAIISGASSGIGAAIAKRFAKEGYELLLLGRDEARLKKVQSECQNKQTEILAFDLNKIDESKELLLKKISELTTPTILVNNAGIFHRGSVEETSADIWLHQFQINLLSAVQLTQVLWPLFKKNKKGSVVNISSTLGLKPTSDTGAYSAMKAAMINWTQSLAQEGGTYNIRANCICPGVIDTPIHDFYHLPASEKKEILSRVLNYQLLHEVGQPDDIADATYFLATENSRWTTGSVLSVDGGINIK